MIVRLHKQTRIINEREINRLSLDNYLQLLTYRQEQLSKQPEPALNEDSIACA